MNPHRFSEAAYAVVVNGVIVAHDTKARAHTLRRQHERAGDVAAVWLDKSPIGTVRLDRMTREAMAAKGLPLPAPALH